MKINEDLSKLTAVPEKTLDKLTQKELYIMCQCIEEDLLEGKNTSEFDFGNFKILIKYDNKEEVKFKVIPSEEFKKALKMTLNSKNILEDKLNQAILKKFMDVYKEIC